jgi:hypothetical protein
MPFTLIQLLVWVREDSPSQAIPFAPWLRFLFVKDREKSQTKTFVGSSLMAGVHGSVSVLSAWRFLVVLSDSRSVW